MTSRTPKPARPSTGSGENGEEVLLDEQPEPGAEAQKQADEVTSFRTVSG